jgi:Zn-dependent metalloprotease
MEFDPLQFPVKIIRQEGDPPVKGIEFSDSYNRLFDYMGVVYDFYKTVYGRNSLDDKGCSIVVLGNSNVALWYSTFEAIYIPFKGDRTSSSTVKICTSKDSSFNLDLISHEFTHGVNYYSEENPITKAQREDVSRILGIKEHLADVFGLLCCHWYTKKADWRFISSYCSEAIFLPARSFDETPSFSGGGMSMDEFLIEDNTKSVLGAGYDNSKILSYAFYLFATFLGGANQIESYDVPGKIWYQILSSTNTEKDFIYISSFATFANASLFYCEQLYPQYLDKLKFAWHKTKVLKPFKDENCKLMILELEYKAAHQSYWLDLGIKDFKNT